MRDFSLEKYRELCRTFLESGYTPRTVLAAITTPVNPGEKVVILRHDVDRQPRNALMMAALEQSAGIRSTYYFRSPFPDDVIRQVSSLGHEIGYHYEVLTRAGGDITEALRLFGKDLQAIRTIAAVRTIAMHGSPLSRHHNLDLWKDHDFLGFGILGDATLSVSPTARYFTDTGRSWNGSANLRDSFCDAGRQELMAGELPRGPGSSPSVPDQAPGHIRSTDSLIACIREGTYPVLYINAHPERWSSGPGEWVLRNLADRLMNAGKLALRVIR